MPDPGDTAVGKSRELAVQQTKLMAGGGTMGTPPTNPASPNCSTGKPSDQQGGGESQPSAPTPGSCGNVIQRQAGIRNHPISSGLNSILSKSAGSINANYVVTSGGQYPSGEGPHTGSVRHNNQGSAAGSLGAADGYFQDCSTGHILSTQNPTDRAKLSSALGTAYKNGATGLGSDYMNGMGGAGKSQLFHIGGGTDRVWGGDTAFLQSAKNGQTPAAATGGQQTAGGNTNGSDCGGQGSGGGCAPINSAAPAVASSINQGLGMNPAAALTSGIQGITSSLTGGLGSAIQGALGSLTGGINNALGSLAGLTSQATSLIQNLGGGMLPSLTGVIPSGISNLLGSGSLTGMAQSFASNLIQQNVPQLGGFTSVLNSAMGASASAGNMMNSVMGSGNQIFGNSVGAMAKLPGMSVGAAYANDLNIAPSTNKVLTGSIPVIVDPDDPDMGLGDNGYEDILMSRLNNRVGLIGPLDEVMTNLINAEVIDGFSSLHYDYQSLVTQGFGSLTTSLVDLGNDLANLGKFGDMSDIFNLGTPQQLARQLIENGFGISSGLMISMMDNGLGLQSLYTKDNAQDIYSILASIDDPNLIADVKKVFGISDSLNIQTLADLVEPAKIFPTSYDFNNFTYLEEIAPFLSLYNMGRIKTLGQFGSLLSSFETVEAYEDLLKENTVIRQTETAGYLDGMLFASKFGFNGPTIADFIGTAAGYVHSETFPVMAKLLNEIDQSEHMAEFQALMQLLLDTLNGNYTLGGYITVPDTSEYSFGAYTTLDDATGAIVGAIEDQLQYLKNNLETLDFNTWLKVQYLETYHWESARYMEHEKRMRKLYGIDIGEPRRTNEFISDGSTAVFKLEEDKSTGHLVYFDGAFVSKKGNWSYNSTNNSITLNSVPTSGVAITIVYDVNTFLPSTTDADGWQFAASLEEYATMGGYGNVSDFLSRITTNDIHGQRINAILRQTRNKNRLVESGVLFPNFDTITDSSNDNSGFNYISYTGIWNKDLNRAAEIQIQNTENVKSFDQYVIQRYAKNKDSIQADLDILLQNITRQLIFYVDDNLAITQLMVDFYQNNQSGEIYQADKKDLYIPYAENQTTDGYVLGPYREILSEIGRKEAITNAVFNQQLSSDTIVYLKDIGVDLSLLVTIIQRILTANVSLSLDISEGDVQNIFGIQGVFKKILQNIADNY